jgi:hypothetical protein
MWTALALERTARFFVSSSDAAVSERLSVQFVLEKDVELAVSGKWRDAFAVLLWRVGRLPPTTTIEEPTCAAYGDPVRRFPSCPRCSVTVGRIVFRLRQGTDYADTKTRRRQIESANVSVW